MKNRSKTTSPSKNRLLGLILLIGAVVTLYACGGGGGGGGGSGSTPAPGTPPATLSKLNDTGITSGQCFGTGTTSLVLCSSPEARALSNAQDGAVGRDADTATNSAVDGKLGFSYTKIAADGSALPASATSWSCVRDNVTGLMWEVKTNDGGLHDYTKMYTNYDNTQLPQVPGGTNPSQAQIDAPTNSVGFKNAVNAATLCGASDWRVPSVHELGGLVDYGAAPGALKIDTAWFPNSPNGSWSSTPDIQSHFKGFVDYRAWLVEFTSGNIFSFYRAAAPVLLVRGSAMPAQLTVSGDGLEVSDASTGLIWRRCAEGQTAANDTCTGTAAPYTLDEAMARANAQATATGQAWRLPNIKELHSLVDTRFYEPAVNETAFPAAPMGSAWSSTPRNDSASESSRVVLFDAGFAFSSVRTARVPTLRLVRTKP